MNRLLITVAVIGFFLSLRTVTANDSAGDQYSSVAKTVIIHNVEIASRDAGIVNDVTVKVGERVELGVPLITLDDAMIDRERRIAELNTVIARLDATSDADLLFSRQSHAFKKLQLSKAEEANRKYAGTVTTSELEQLSLDVEQARLSGELAEMNQSIKQKTVELKSEQEAIAQLQMSYRTIRAPISGTVLEVRKQVGESITAGEVAVRIVNLERLRVVSHLSQQAIDLVSVGDDVTFVPARLSLADKPVTATVTFINPELNAEEGVFEIWAEFDNRELRLLGGEVGKVVLDR
jgi:multidrug efflux pump subunit AcrA (membrane-fusion protein)